MVVGVAERLEAVDAGGAAHRRTVVDDLAGRLDDLSEAFAELIEQPGAARHRIPQHRIHVISLHMAHYEDLEVVHVGCAPETDHF